MKRSLILFVIFVMTVTAFVYSVAAENMDVRSDEIYVKQLDIPEDFIFGMDSSCVPALEKSGVRYYDHEGREKDVFEILRENGINAIRVRVWNDPFDAKGRGYGGGNCDIYNCIEIGKRANAYGLKLIVSFHYSDFWADPSKQMVPKAWKDMKIKEKAEAAYEYTRDCLNILREAGIDVCMVSVGNETNNYMCGEKTWFNIQYIMQAGAKATREVYPDALVALHFTNPEKGNYMTYASKMDYYNVDYDVFASSYYPYWHGTLDNLAAELNNVAETYGKKVMVMETSYAFTELDTDFSGNTISDSGTVIKNYPFTVQGQANSVSDITETLVNRTTNGIGIVYWEGTWITVGTESYEENSSKWEEFGSGWATSYAAGYDPLDAGRYYGGCAVDNQALFGADGKALESLKVFALMKIGNTIPVRPDALEDISLICDINAPVVLPESVNAVMNDNSRRSIPVTWNFSKADEELMHLDGPARYDVTGTADGMIVHCYVNMVEYNYINDYSFENGGENWVFTDLKNCDELYVEDKKSDSLTGTKHGHFWSGGRNTVEFKLEQEIETLPSGNYSYAVSIMGGDCGNTEIYCYVQIGDEIVEKCPMKITSYGNWDTGRIPLIRYDGKKPLRVGIYVKCEGTGNGAWGKIDDALLNSVSETK